MLITTLLHAAEALAEQLESRSLILATAESCTGGWVSQALTEISGSSNWFERGFVTYSNEAKQEMLGVPSSVIEQQGAVSRETACAMVAGALKYSHANVALSVTGIAGPTGGTPDKPVGLVWFAWATAEDKIMAEKRIFSGDRHHIRQQAVLHAIEGMFSRLSALS